MSKSLSWTLEERYQSKLAELPWLLPAVQRLEQRIGELEAALRDCIDECDRYPGLQNRIRTLLGENNE